MLRRFLLPFMSLVIVSGCGESGPDKNPAQINRAMLEPARGVLLIVIDTLRADYLGLYNKDHPFSPALDEFAAESVVFDAMYASAPWTRSSIASIFTSRYPTEINVQGKRDALDDKFLTVAEVFHEHGFETYGINTNDNVNNFWGFDQGFDFYGMPELPGWETPEKGPNFPAELVTGVALNRLHNRESDRPLFLYTLYLDPHDPYFSYPELMGGRTEPEGRFDGASREDLRELDKLPAKKRTREDEARILYQYESEVRYTDLWLGRLFEGLKELGLYDEYLIVVTSDHGEELWDHGRRDHGTSLYDEMVRVPLIIRFPGKWRIPPKRVSAPVGHVDIAPTLLAAAGIDVPAEFVGVDLWDDAEDYYMPDPDQLAYTEMQRRGLYLEAVSNGQYKLIRDRAMDLPTTDRSHVIRSEDTLWNLSRRYFGNFNHIQRIVDANPVLSEQGVSYRDIELEVGNELNIPDRREGDWEIQDQFYDLTLDPKERNNLFSVGDDPQPFLMNSLLTLNREIRERQQTGRWVEDSDVDEETLKGLRGLGYVQ